jgi:hypothetical protein
VRAEIGETPLDVLRKENELLKATINSAETAVADLAGQLTSQGVEVPPLPTMPSMAGVAPVGIQPEDFWSPAVTVPEGHEFIEEYGRVSPIPDHDGTECLKWDPSLWSHADHFKVSGSRQHARPKAAACNAHPSRLPWGENAARHGKLGGRAVARVRFSGMDGRGSSTNSCNLASQRGSLQPHRQRRPAGQHSLQAAAWRGGCASPPSQCRHVLLSPRTAYSTAGTSSSPSVRPSIRTRAGWSSSHRVRFSEVLSILSVLSASVFFGGQWMGNC